MNNLFSFNKLKKKTNESSAINPESLRHDLSAACALLKGGFELLLNPVGDREDAIELHTAGMEKMRKVLLGLDRSLREQGLNSDSPDNQDDMDSS